MSHRTKGGKVEKVSGTTKVGVEIGKVEYILTYSVVWLIFVTVGEALVKIGRLPDDIAGQITKLLAPFEEILKPVLTMINGRQKQDATQSPKEPLREKFRELVENGAKPSEKLWAHAELVPMIEEAQVYTSQCVIGGGPQRDRVTQKEKQNAGTNLGEMGVSDEDLRKLADGKLTKKQLAKALGIN